MNGYNKGSVFTYVFENPADIVRIELTDTTSTMNGKDHSRALLLGAMDVQLTAILHKFNIPYTLDD